MNSTCGGISTIQTEESMRRKQTTGEERLYSGNGKLPSLEYRVQQHREAYRGAPPQFQENQKKITLWNKRQ